MSKITNAITNSKFSLKEKLGIPTSKICLSKEEFPFLYHFLRNEPSELKKLERLLAACKSKNYKLTDQLILSFAFTRFPRMKQVLSLNEIINELYELTWHPFEVCRALQRMVMHYDFLNGMDKRLGDDLVIIERIRRLFFTVGEDLGVVDEEEVYDWGKALRNN